MHTCRYLSGFGQHRGTKDGTVEVVGEAPGKIFSSEILNSEWAGIVEEVVVHSEHIGDSYDSEVFAAPLVRVAQQVLQTVGEEQLDVPVAPQVVDFHLCQPLEGIACPSVEL
ncbi:hypothetical protein Scep_002053 [Stephania cephalantha]|uniref:Uncharacterized protein n=1 Tax=Stephania cephalantha TaxID=152367 RepID=A0AAP0LAP8_9MAGN